MNEIKLKAWGIFSLTKKQFILIEIIILTFFISITVFLFIYQFPTFFDDTVLNFHAKYSKYISLICTFLVVIESQFFLNRYIRVQLELIEEQNKMIELQNNELQVREKEIMAQQIEIEAQRDLARQQRDAIEKQKNNITDSIHYASRIQAALLPPHELVNKILPNHFILYKPRDIVSGDYYWFAQKENKTIIVGADCTGHGVPGAFMSMLGIAFLNEIVNQATINLHASEILDELRNRVIRSLRQDDNVRGMKDGMDAALYIIDTERKVLEFAGANTPLYLLRKKSENEIVISSQSFTKEDDGIYELIQIRADRMPIGILSANQSFSNHEVQLEEGTNIYIFSDGYVDQFGGADGKKFLLKQVKKLLFSLQDKPILLQKEILNDTFMDWKGKLDQVDDILVIGISI